MLEGDWYDSNTETAKAFNTGVPTGFLFEPADATYYGVRLGMGLDALDYIPAESFNPGGQTFFQLTGKEADCTLQYREDTVEGPILEKIVIKNTKIYDSDLTYHREVEK